jgi:hypothetical protein
MCILTTLSFAAALALSGPASAGLRLPKELIELTPDLIEIVDATSKIGTNDVPSIVSEDGGLYEYARRVAKVHFGHEFPEAPPIEGDRVFSPDPEVREQARRKYDEFVKGEAKDIEGVKAREDRASALKTYEQIYKRYADFANKAPDMIDAAGKADNYQMAVEIAAGCSLPSKLSPTSTRSSLSTAGW